MMWIVRLVRICGVGFVEVVAMTAAIGEVVGGVIVEGVEGRVC